MWFASNVKDEFSGTLCHTLGPATLNFKILSTEFYGFYLISEIFMFQFSRSVGISLIPHTDINWSTFIIGISAVAMSFIIFPFTNIDVLVGICISALNRVKLGSNLGSKDRQNVIWTYLFQIFCLQTIPLHKLNHQDNKMYPTHVSCSVCNNQHIEHDFWICKFLHPRVYPSHNSLFMIWPKISFFHNIEEGLHLEENGLMKVYGPWIKCIRSCCGDIRPYTFSRRKYSTIV